MILYIVESEPEWNLYDDFDYPDAALICALLDWHPYADTFTAIWGDCVEPLPPPVWFDQTNINLDDDWLWTLNLLDNWLDENPFIEPPELEPPRFDF